MLATGLQQIGPSDCSKVLEYVTGLGRHRVQAEWTPLGHKLPMSKLASKQQGAQPATWRFLISYDNVGHACCKVHCLPPTRQVMLNGCDSCHDPALLQASCSCFSECTLCVSCTGRKTRTQMSTRHQAAGVHVQLQALGKGAVGLHVLHAQKEQQHFVLHDGLIICSLLLMTAEVRKHRVIQT